MNVAVCPDVFLLSIQYQLGNIPALEINKQWLSILISCREMIEKSSECECNFN